MQQAFKRHFVAYWALLPEIQPDTQDAVRGGWKGWRQEEEEEKEEDTDKKKKKKK